ncbi:hypothetical protein Gohar_001055, partial [Gossypium harknessii]|nr:hypothetical protein [Gossypium harknessii]
KLASLENLANRDLSQSTLNKVSRARYLDLLTSLRSHFIYLTYNILDLSKLCYFKDSSNELYTFND